MDYSKLYQFLNKQTGKFFNDQSPNYWIEKDLGIYGDEAVDFLVQFSSGFDVNISDFNFAEHFNSESDKISLFVSNFFKRKNKKDLTIQDLKDALIKRRLE
ncbi:hypothetical protein ACWA1F_22775 [Flavobacterium sp. 3-218]